MSCWLPWPCGRCSALLCECCWPCHWGHTASAAREGNCPDREPSGIKHSRMSSRTSKTHRRRSTDVLWTQPTVAVAVEADMCVNGWVAGIAGLRGSSPCRHLAKGVGRATAESSHGSKLWSHGLCSLGGHLRFAIELSDSIY